ncbi:hypothetical protein [Rothia aerolata]|uniref:Uncharacterized protein n=1 Tax=Rothia aerolata TaxID=1812262 RepID=A0A917INJ9_9MICC|nr:hypothetical protein [Rothia aerolata]GGH58071.1 hypothetical protein GCM10007359_03860 [Rothia aerolata]
MTTPNLSNNIVENPNYFPGLAVSAIENQDCPYYFMGHTIHWIRRHHAAKEAWYPATILGVEGNWITFESEGEVLRMWNHDAQKLSAIFDAVQLIENVPVQWCPRFKLLGAVFEAGGFSVGLDYEKDRDCPLTLREKETE